MGVIAQALGWTGEANIVKWFARFHDRPLVAFVAFGLLDAALALLASLLLVPRLRALLRVGARRTDWLGLAGNGLALALRSAAPRYALIAAAASAPCLLAWYCLLGADLLRGGRDADGSR